MHSPRRAVPKRLARLLLLLLGSAAPAAAQDNGNATPPAVLPVYDQPRPSYEMPGLPLGSFLLVPSLAQTLAYDDNIFASDARRAGDFVSTTSEALAVQSQWARHGLGGRTWFAQQVYGSQSTQDANTYGVEAAGRLDMTADSALRLAAGFVQQPQRRSSPQADSLSLDRPIFNTINANASWEQEWDRFRNRAQFGFIQTAYTTMANANRNGVELRYIDRFSAALTGSLWSYVQFGYTTRNWLRNGDRRNFNTLSGLIGVSTQVTDLVEGEIGMGVLRQQFRYDGFDALVTPVVSGRVTWNILPLTSLSAMAERTVSGVETFCDTPQAFLACQKAAGGSLSAPGNRRSSLEVTAAEMGVQHEFWHDLLGEFRLRYERDEFDFAGLINHNYGLELNGRFLVNRTLELDLTYNYNVRDANKAITLYNSGPYTENVVSLTVKVAG